MPIIHRVSALTTGTVTVSSPPLLDISVRDETTAMIRAIRRALGKRIGG